MTLLERLAAEAEARGLTMVEAMNALFAEGRLTLEFTDRREFDPKNGEGIRFRLDES